MVRTGTGETMRGPGPALDASAGPEGGHATAAPPDGLTVR